MKNFIFASVVSLVSFSTASAETLSGKSPSWAIPNFKSGFEYTITASRKYTVTRFINSAASGRPVKFAASCDGVGLGEAFRFYDVTQKNKIQELSFNASFDNVTCPSGNITFEFTHPGLEVTSDSMNADVLQIVETIESYLSRIEAERILKNKTLVQISAKLATIAVARPSMYCLIEKHSDDIVMSGIVGDLITEYERNFGKYNKGDFTCPSAASGQLAASITNCTNDPDDLSQFCLVYDRYTKAEAWYSTVLSELSAKKSKFTDTESAMYQEIAGLEKRITDDRTATKSIVN